MERGAISLPLWGDPHDRSYQKVDWQRGKSNLTRFQVIARVAGSTRMEFFRQDVLISLGFTLPIPEGLGYQFWAIACMVVVLT